LRKHQLARNSYFLFNAGSGGHKLDGVYAADIFAEAAAEFSKHYGKPCLMIFGSNYPKPLPQISGVTCIQQMQNTDFINLMASAEGVVLSCGDTVLQAINLLKPCVAAPVSKDQPARIKACLNLDLLLSSSTTSDALVTQTMRLIQTGKQKELITNMKKNSVANGLDHALKDIALLLKLE